MNSGGPDTPGTGGIHVMYYGHPLLGEHCNNEAMDKHIPVRY